MYGCGGGHVDVVRFLLEQGASLEAHNEHGYTPLMTAACAGHVEVAKILLSKEHTTWDQTRPERNGNIAIHVFICKRAHYHRTEHREPLWNSLPNCWHISAESKRSEWNGYIAIHVQVSSLAHCDRTEQNGTEEIVWESVDILGERIFHSLIFPTIPSTLYPILGSRDVYKFAAEVDTVDVDTQSRTDIHPARTQPTDHERRQVDFPRFTVPSPIDIYI